MRFFSCAKMEEYAMTAPHNIKVVGYIHSLIIKIWLCEAIPQSHIFILFYRQDISGFL